ncbi:SDR family oxidoreductase [Caldimonas thermodepolymerans]|jgi:Dehydrogenases with different specificities (related to short-chain alcohol dehydrogenases)|uniref:NAD(P)-dependent dehydrogenase (Short-subunit alcohol dehydrogenase family) n=1 Tax=Caldimonas thermodepolymerans TaxID=215580 RepID=A0AA46DEL0_9BURK|nr:SDR family oxidoreductase [Caldimonas thermodepolymerans]TCP08267.1 NAD(P)-dependent dehydrogenase (short-subunit alcohol dehydrogenase family) [Caldimonas thermodepolymerans]UZG48620.1 SDR family oxidoreductase [Caldimonas thermodepolymerans]
MARTDSRSNGRHDPDAVAARQRAIQHAQDERDEQAQGDATPGEPPPTGTRDQPRNPLPQQHLEKPGLEAEMALKPRFMAPDYQGSGKLRDMVALITGGDSGIGRAVAVLYAREGADVAIAYLNEHEDAEETKRCVEAEGRRCLLIAGDVKDPAWCRRAVEQVVQAFGGLDILVNNAAFQEHAQSLEDLSEERFDETLRTNVYGYFHMAKAALPHLGPGSSIINTGSVVGLRGSSHLLDYSTTKGAIHAFTKALAQNVLERGIRVNAVAPGPVWTPLNPADSPPEKVPDFGRQTDMKRAAQPEELSPAYVFLASPVCASYVTGIVLPVTGTVGAI